MSIEAAQTIVNAVLLLVVAFVGGTLGLRRFESMESSIADLRTELKGDIGDLRTDLRGDIATMRAELAELRSELGQTRSDLTYVALAIGARPAQGSG